MTVAGSVAALAADRLAVLDAVVARLIPSDESGPGAAEARVSRYITNALAGDYRHHLRDYQDGLQLIDDHARSQLGGAFTQLSAVQQDAVLVELERGRVGSPASQFFFELVLRHAREGMFGDPQWGGNADRIGWQLLGYPGPRYVWSEEEQRIEDTGQPA